MSSEREHKHRWQWVGYYFTLDRESVLQFVCECGWKKEERFPMAEEWYSTAYAFWQFEQHNRGVLNAYRPEREESKG